MGSSAEGQSGQGHATGDHAPENIPDVHPSWASPQLARLLGVRPPMETQDELCQDWIADYKIIARIGGGSTGVVYKAEQVRLKRIVALKLLSRQHSDTFHIERFRIEAITVAKMNHPNILQIFDTGIWQGQYYLAMEFVAGRSIHDILFRLRKLPVAAALAIVSQIAQALIEMAVHGVVHRDIKPENIMLNIQGVAKLADLGLAKNIDYGDPTDELEKKLILGTPYYMAPEQIDDPTKVDSRSDIYALGVTFYRMITGEIPFYDTTLMMILKKVKTLQLPLASEVDPSIPMPVSHLVAKMVQKDPAQRFQTPQQLLAALHALRSVVREKAPPAGSPPASSALPKKVRKGTKLEPPQITKLMVADRIDTSHLTFQEEEAAPEVSAPTPPTPPPSPVLHAHKNAGPTLSAGLWGTGLGVLLLLVLGWCFWPRDHSNTTGRPAPVAVTPTTSFDRAHQRKCDLQILELRIAKYRHDPKKFKALLQACDDYITRYLDTPEATRVMALMGELQQAQMLYHRREAFEQQRRQIGDLLAQGKYQQAWHLFQNLKRQRKFAFFNRELSTVKEQISQQAQISANEQIRLAQELVARQQFDQACQKLQAALVDQLPSVITQLQATIRNIRTQEQTARQRREQERIAAQRRKSQQYRQNFQAAQQLAARHDYAAALRLLTDVIAGKADFAPAYVLRAEIYVHQNKLPAALRNFTRALRYEPKSVALYLARAQIYLRCQDYPKALADYEKALGLTPKKWQIFGLRGMTYYHMHSYTQALRDLNWALTLNPRYALAYYWRGKLYMDQGKFRQGRADWQKALQLNVGPPYQGYIRSAGIIK